MTNKRLEKYFSTADRLAQLIERRTTVREVEGSSPRPDQLLGECAAFVFTSANG